jgi:thioester reductase-like protein
VELGEIEAVLCQHPEVRQAVVLPTTGSSENRQLAAYVELTGDEITALGHTETVPEAEPAASRVHRLHTQAVKDYLADRLPEYMVPRYVVQVDHIPVSANGKIDYRGLPVISEEAMESMRDWVLPRNEVEQTIFDAWSRIIVGCEIGVTDNFFELGGDSILATQIVREINAALPAFNLEIHELFENITIESLAALFQSRSVPRPEHALPGPDDMLQMDAASSIEHAAIIADLRAAVDSLGSLDFNPGQTGSPCSPQAVFITGGTGWLGVHVLSELLTHTQAEIHCLVRSSNAAEGHKRLLENMRQHGMVIDPSWPERVLPVCGDLTRPQLGVGLSDWRRLSATVDSIYHLGASVNVLVDYSTHRKVNVNALVSIVRLAVEHHIKPVFFSSPMAVCRRYKDGRLHVLPEESSHADPDGLLTGYSQSKWAAEQILLAAAQRGLPVKIYRSSHALPSTRNGKAKRNDTYDSILKAAYAAGIVPDWADSRLYGVPVDTLGRLLVENSLDADGYQGVIHIENQDPLSLKSIIEILLEEKQSGNGSATCVSADEWKTRCLEVAAELPAEIAGLVKVLFTKRALGTAVDNMFSEHPVDTHYLNGRGQAQRISDLTPVEYWRAVFLNPSWSREEVCCD